MSKLNIILIARSQERARRLIKELRENNPETTFKGYPPVQLVDNTMQISAFSKESVESLKSLTYIDQIFVEEGIDPMTTSQYYIIANMLKNSYVPIEYQIQVLKENY